VRPPRAPFASPLDPGKMRQARFGEIEIGSNRKSGRDFVARCNKFAPRWGNTLLHGDANFRSTDSVFARRAARRASREALSSSRHSACASSSAASSEPRQSLTGRDIWPRVTEYRAIPKADTEAHHATERAAPTTFRSQRTAYAPNICRPSRAVHRCRRLPSSQ
jgi:hypothetical protein